MIRKPGGPADTIKVRTDPPPLHLRNTIREPIISSRLGLLGRYCSESRSSDYQHTINSGLDTTTRERAVLGGRRVPSAPTQSLSGLQRI